MAGTERQRPGSGKTALAVAFRFKCGADGSEPEFSDTLPELC